MSSASAGNSEPEPATSTTPSATDIGAPAQAHHPGGTLQEINDASRTSLRISTHVDGNTTVLYLAGELDIANADGLRQEIRLILDRHDPQVLLLDLSQLAFTDSSGLAAIVWAHQQLTARKGQLRLQHPSPLLSRVLHTTGLHNELHLTPAPHPPRRSELAADAAATRTRAAHDGNTAD
jgi:anti-anti-sigma factor